MLTTTTLTATTFDPAPRAYARPRGSSRGARLPELSSEMSQGDGIQQRDPAETELIEAVRASDRSVASRMYRQLRPAVDRAITRILGYRAADHEDFVQLAFEQAVISIVHGTFQRDCSLTTWISLIASRVALSEQRRRYRARRLVETSVPYFEANPSATAKIEARSDLRRVQFALAQLEPGRAETLLLHDVEGHALADVARILGISLSAAHARLVRGRRQLRDLLRKETIRP